MNKPRVIRWTVGAAVAAALVFGTAQAFAAPGARQTSSSCEPWDCRGQCPEGCGPGTCTPYGCECFC